MSELPAMQHEDECDRLSVPGKRTGERSRPEERAAQLGERPARVTHLLAADDVLSPGRWGAYITVCGAQVRPPSATAAADEYDPSCVRYCQDCVHEACRGTEETAPAGTGGHPPWCSPQHCYLTEEGIRVHVQRPVRWRDDTGEVQFTSGLIHPLDDDRTYLELMVTSSPLRDSVHAVMSMAAARRLRDQLSAHDQDAAQTT